MGTVEGATEAEWRRFRAARPGDEEAAREMLSTHLAWRRRCLPLPECAPRIGGGLPDFAALLGSRTRDGFRVLHVSAAMYDSSAGSHDEYALAFAALFEEFLQPDSEEKFTVVIDTRGGEGFANPRPWSALPWLRVLSSTLSANFPERLNKLIVVPVPWVASTVWSAVSAFLDQRTSDKVSLLSGPAGRTEPIPATIAEFLDDECLAECEAMRRKRLDALVVQPAAPAVAPAGEPAADESTSYGLAELELA